MRNKRRRFGLIRMQSSLIDRQWLYDEPQVYYPIVMVGYGDENYSFDDMLGICCYLFGPGMKDSWKLKQID